MKTWARETFWAMLVFLAYLTVGGNVELVETLVWPIFTFGLAAFGMKQEAIIELTKNRGVKK